MAGLTVVACCVSEQRARKSCMQVSKRCWPEPLILTAMTSPLETLNLQEFPALAELRRLPPRLGNNREVVLVDRQRDPVLQVRVSSSNVNICVCLGKGGGPVCTCCATLPG